ncbi:hypothetical protein A1D29_09135 [Pasteurellaceae bacterium Orientalotternb1]|nr:hypothetical protein A1D29_09135 [Pasteurellaceae bacterium Orientalotternb1]
MFELLKKASNKIDGLYKTVFTIQQPTTIFDGRVKIHSDGSLEVDYTNQHVRAAIQKHAQALSAPAQQQRK